MMNPDIKTRWVAALRSGDYAQGQDFLARNVNGVVEHCCLGVLCDLAAADGIVEKGVGYYGVDIITFQADTDPSAATALLPPSVLEWAEHEGYLMVVEVDGEKESLNGLNDTGYAFAQIADLIEAQL